MDLAIAGTVTATALLTLPGAAALPKEAQDLLKSITQAELDALRSLYKRAQAHASTADLRKYGPIH
jgi:hypothetical protein